MKDAAELFLAYAGNYLYQQDNISAGIAAARENPDIVLGTIEGMDATITSLNGFISHPQNLEGPIEIMPNTMFVREKLRSMLPVDYPIHLPTLSELAKDTDSYTRQYGKRTFIEASQAMMTGDNGYEEGWQFHRTLTDPAQLSDALGLEIYGLYTSKPFPELFGYEKRVVTALEEMLALFHNEQRLFYSVKDWITEEEGFSPLLAELVASINKR